MPIGKRWYYNVAAAPCSVTHINETYLRFPVALSTMSDLHARLRSLRQVLAVPAGTKPCDVSLQGADKLVKNLPGGLDGTYAVWSCENGRPLYKRQDSPAGREPHSSYPNLTPLGTA